MRADLQTLSSGYYSTALLNNNFEKINEALAKLLSRVGEEPNEMLTNLDMNGHGIYNIAYLGISGRALVDVPLLIDQIASIPGFVKRAEQAALDAEQAAAEIAITFANEIENIVLDYIYLYSNTGLGSGSPFLTSVNFNTLTQAGVYTVNLNGSLNKPTQLASLEDIEAMPYGMLIVARSKGHEFNATDEVLQMFRTKRHLFTRVRTMDNTGEYWTDWSLHYSSEAMTNFDKGIEKPTSFTSDLNFDNGLNERILGWSHVTHTTLNLPYALDNGQVGLCLTVAMNSLDNINNSTFVKQMLYIQGDPNVWVREQIGSLSYSQWQTTNTGASIRGFEDTLTSINLNTLTDAGVYTVELSTCTNIPLHIDGKMNLAETQATLLVINTRYDISNERVFQLLSDNNGELSTRSYQKIGGNYAWTPWLKHYDNSSYTNFDKGLDKEMPYASDLNSLNVSSRILGYHYVNDTTLGIPSNYPAGKLGICHTVAINSLSNLNNSALTIQTLFVEDSNLVFKRQKKNAETYGAWTEIGSSSSSAVSLGLDQTYQNLTSSRLNATTYTNNTSKPIQVSIMIFDATYEARGDLMVSTTPGGSTWNIVSRFKGPYIGSGANRTATLQAIVPPGYNYRTSIDSSISQWLELR